MLSYKVQAGGDQALGLNGELVRIWGSVTNVWSRELRPDVELVPILPPEEG